MSCGDIIYSLPFVRHIQRKSEDYCTLYIQQSKHVTDYDTFESLERLLDLSYVSVERYAGQAIDYDLDKVRSGGSLRTVKHWENYFKVFNIIPFWDSFLPWLEVAAITNSIGAVFHITERYGNHTVDFNDLIEKEVNPYFIGLPGEFEKWKHHKNLTYLNTTNLYEMAQAIKDSNRFYCNQSSGLVIAQALGHKNINLALHKGFKSVFGLRKEIIL